MCCSLRSRFANLNVLFPSHVLYYHVSNELENGGYFNLKAGDFNCAHLQLSSAFKLQLNYDQVWR